MRFSQSEGAAGLNMCDSATWRMHVHVFIRIVCSSPHVHFTSFTRSFYFQLVCFIYNKITIFSTKIIRTSLSAIKVQGGSSQGCCDLIFIFMTKVFKKEMLYCFFVNYTKCHRLSNKHAKRKFFILLEKKYFL